MQLSILLNIFTVKVLNYPDINYLYIKPIDFSLLFLHFYKQINSQHKYTRAWEVDIRNEPFPIQMIHYNH